MLRWLHYDDREHERIFTYDGSEQYLPSRLELDVYGLVAYATPVRLEPYVQVEYTDKSYVLPRYAGAARATPAGLASLGLSVGCNVELTSHTLFKIQVTYLSVHDAILDTTAFETPLVFVRLVSSF